VNLDKKEIFKALSDDATYATTAHVIALGTFGDDIYDMDPLELFSALEDEYKSELSEEVAEKMQAILLATVTDAFYEDPMAFRAIANTLLEGDPGFDGFDNVTVPEILWAIYEVELNHESRNFSPKVANMIEHELENEGEDIDTLDEAMNSTYHQRSVREFRRELEEQLAAVGVEDYRLPDIG
jgi:ribosome recycling factor